MVGIAVLGAGRIGKIHAASVAANPKATLVAVADPFPDAVEPLAKSPGSNCGNVSGRYSPPSGATPARRAWSAVTSGASPRVL